MKNSCHVGVEDDVFYKLAFFFFLEKRLFLSHKLLQPEAYRKFTLCDCVESFTQNEKKTDIVVSFVHDKTHKRVQIITLKK